MKPATPTIPKKYLKKRKVDFWGTTHEVTPIPLKETFGDARQLIKFQTLNHRPERYLIQIDSTTDLDTEEFHDLIEDIAQALEDEFGPSTWQNDAGEWQHDPFPAYSGDSGCTWAHLATLPPA